MSVNYILLVLLFSWTASLAWADDCLVPSNNSDGLMSLKFLSNYGNVTYEINGTHIVGISFCTPEEFFSRGKSCGSGFMILYEKECDGVLSLSDKLQNINNSISFSLRSRGDLVADIYVHCDDNYKDLSVIDYNQISQNKYVFKFASMTVCPGYNSKNNDEMLSKGAIIAIVSGIVGIVVIAAAIFQWKSRSRSGDDYSQLI